MKNSSVSFNFRVSKSANFFHFIANLADLNPFWRPSTYKDYWISTTGLLNEREKQVLANFRNYFTEGEKQKLSQWRSLFTKEWDLLSLDTMGSGFDLRTLVEMFLPRFEKIWVEEKRLLMAWEEKIKSRFGVFISSDLANELDRLFNFERKMTLVEVVLLMRSPNDKPSGGANLGKDFVTLETSRVPLDYSRPVWLYLLHETLHCLWQGVEYRKMIDDFSKGPKGMVDSSFVGIPLEILLNEAVTESLFPFGYLAEKYFDFPSNDYFTFSKGDYLKGEAPYEISVLMAYWRRFSASKLRFLVKDYLLRQMTIDENFLCETVKIFCDFKKEATA